MSKPSKNSGGKTTESEKKIGTECQVVNCGIVEKTERFIYPGLIVVVIRNSRIFFFKIAKLKFFMIFADFQQHLRFFKKILLDEFKS